MLNEEILRRQRERETSDGGPLVTTVQRSSCWSKKSPSHQNLAVLLNWASYRPHDTFDHLRGSIVQLPTVTASGIAF